MKILLALTWATLLLQGLPTTIDGILVLLAGFFGWLLSGLIVRLLQQRQNPQLIDPDISDRVKVAVSAGCCVLVSIVAYFASVWLHGRAVAEADFITMLGLVYAVQTAWFMGTAKVFKLS